MYQLILRKTFVASLALALCGGIVFVLLQLAGMIFGSALLLTGPNAVFKTVLCICASIASIAAYLLLHVGSTPVKYAQENSSK
ncbi:MULTISPECIES: hypothetical protein [Micrococcaceae]|uniref:hypothetical protein n=1 Tax=Micrococcaceae TaxID=1268 RepID=UPI0010368B68|nr:MULTISPECIES: hypothetical protein [Micrococcaceae]TAP24720.1 hypothetical protein EYR88_15660 [Arthrobacter sp. S41]UXN32269.1 hypothetical protein N6V40_01885 [Glutamicibacter sp. M10]